jgi:hypothetical protein
MLPRYGTASWAHSASSPENGRRMHDVPYVSGDGFVSVVVRVMLNASW